MQDLSPLPRRPSFVGDRLPRICDTNLDYGEGVNLSCGITFDAVDSVACLECGWRITDRLFMCWPIHRQYCCLKPIVQKRLEAR